MVLEQLHEKYKGEEKYKYLKVVILPGPSDVDPLPTNGGNRTSRKQVSVSKNEKPEYYNFDMALAVKRKLDLGMELDEILLDDANYEGLTGNALKNKIQEFRDEYIEPLKCVDKYLEELKRPGHYNTVSEGKGNKEGRWQAFLDYYKLFKKLKNERERIKLNIQDGDEGKIENIAFKIIRKRILQGVDKKAHEIMRQLPKLIANPEAKKELFKLVKIDLDLPREEITDEEGKEVDEKTKDTIWGNKYASDVIHHVRRAFDIFEQRKEHDTPIELLNAALDKLNHSNMDVDLIDYDRIDEAMKLAREIQSRGNELEHLMYEAKKKLKKLTTKNKGK